MNTRMTPMMAIPARLAPAMTTVLDTREVPALSRVLKSEEFDAADKLGKVIIPKFHPLTI